MDSFYKANHKSFDSLNQPVIIMESVKGGLLANLPKNSDLTADASLALRFCGELDGVLAILSGMFNLTQVKQNIDCMKAFQPNPGFAAELNYYSIEKAKNHLLLKDSSLEVEDEKLNQLIKEADDFLANHSFANYDSKLKRL